MSVLWNIAPVPAPAPDHAVEEHDHDLIDADTGEVLRAATAAEVEESDDAGPTGIFRLECGRRAYTVPA